MKKTVVISVISFFLFTTANAAEMSRHELDVNDFSELKVIDGINVDYKCNSDSAGLAVFVATPEHAQAIMFSNKNNKLEIQLTTDGVNYKSLPTVTVYSGSLTKVENSGDSTVRIINITPVSKFKARIIGNGRLIVRDVNVTQIDGSIDTGNGQLVIYGKCQTAKLTSTGTGSIQADELEATDVSIKLWGTGTVGCNINKGTLSIVGAGSGKVYYKGQPQKIKNRTMGIKAISLTTDDDE